MKLTIKHPVGVEVTFEGDLKEFEEVKQFLAEPPAFVEAIGSAPVVAMAPALLSGGNGGTGIAAADPAGGTSASPIEPRALAERLAEVGATTDIERVTVMTQAALDAGLDGIDYTTVERLYRELGLRLPTKIRATFSNAKQRGLVRSLGQGKWRTTVAGENYARLGRDGARRRGTAQRPALSPPAEGGEEPDD